MVSLLHSSLLASLSMRHLHCSCLALTSSREIDLSLCLALSLHSLFQIDKLRSDLKTKEETHARLTADFEKQKYVSMHVGNDSTRSGISHQSTPACLLRCAFLAVGYHFELGCTCVEPRICVVLLPTRLPAALNRSAIALLTTLMLARVPVCMQASGRYFEGVFGGVQKSGSTEACCCCGGCEKGG